MQKLAPIKSASIILQRSDNTVLMCKRSKEVSFFPTFWVFPGGKIETELPEDWTGQEPVVIETIMDEMFEEIGVIPGRSDPVSPEKRSKSYLDFDYNPKTLREFKRSITYIGKKMTPQFRVKTYNAAYYYIAGSLVDEFNPQVDGSELTELVWIHPKDALKKWKQWEMRIPPPILHLLRTLTDCPDQIQIKTLVETELPIGLQTKVEFSPGFELIPFESRTIPPFAHTNLVVITSAGECMIVDPGAMPHEQSHFKEVILSLPSVPCVFITHDHSDHWNGLQYVEDIYPTSRLYGHPKTLERVRTKLERNPITEGSIKIGSKIIEVLHAPGHTDGHMVLHDKDTGTLVAGDHVVGYGSAVLSSETGDMEEYFDTTYRLIDLNLKVLLPAHGPPNFNPDKLLKYYIKHRQEREEAISQSIHNGKTTLDEIVYDVYQDVPQEMWEVAKNNIILHIKKLRNEKKISQDYKFNR